MEDLYRNGAAGFLEKPFGVKHLFDMLGRWSEETDEPKASVAERT